jgi:hypothetical protein
MRIFYTNNRYVVLKEKAEVGFPTPAPRRVVKLLSLYLLLNLKHKVR